MTIFLIFSETVAAVCNVVEAIFIHGLKPQYFVKGSRFSKYPEPVSVIDFIFNL